MKFKNLVYALMFLLVACKQDTGPGESLRKFINYRFSDGQNYKVLGDMVTGQYLDYINQIQSRTDDEGVKAAQAFLNVAFKKGLEKRSLKILGQNCEESKCFLTYLLKFNQPVESDNEGIQVEVKSMAELVKRDSKWLISNINDIKTHINSPEL